MATEEERKKKEIRKSKETSGDPQKTSQLTTDRPFNTNDGPARGLSPRPDRPSGPICGGWIGEGRN